MAAVMAVETTNMFSSKIRLQDVADSAVLAAARSYAEDIKNDEANANFSKYKTEATKTGQSIIDSYARKHEYINIKSEFEYSASDVSLQIQATANMKLMQIFGREKFEVAVATQANLPIYKLNDIDIALITDATGSMATQIAAVQQNMQSLPVDLQAELDNVGIKVGRIRVKILFYRDYTFDSVPSVGSRFDTPPNPWDGAMFESEFFEYPGDVTRMQTYVDQFAGAGGGDTPESGVEALIHAIDSVGWGDGVHTVRSVILWTDAPNKTLHSSSQAEYEGGASYLEDGMWYSNEDWQERISADFALLDALGREQYMYDEHYPSDDIPSHLDVAKSKFENFHAENANGASDIVTFHVNVLDNCLNATGSSVCGDWAELGNWDGVSINLEPTSVTSDDTYQKTVKNIAEAATAQILSRELAIGR